MRNIVDMFQAEHTWDEPFKKLKKMSLGYFSYMLKPFRHKSFIEKYRNVVIIINNNI